MKRVVALFTRMHVYRTIGVMCLVFVGSLLFTTAAHAQVAYPTFSIVGVVPNESVTIRVINLPPNTDFAFRMGPFGTQGLSGEFIDVQNSGAGGVQEFTVQIPEAVQGLSAIAIRMDNFYLGYYAYNWFSNTDTPAETATPTPAPATVEPDPAPATSTPASDPATPTTPVYTGFPSFSVTAVQRNETVTIQTNNLPPNLDFVVRMNFMGTQGVGGQVAQTINSGAGGTQVLTFEIPAAYANQAQIAIRMDNPASGLYAFNWFYNYTATVN